MKGLIRISAGMALALSLFLAGCGRPMAALTETEEELIVAYASGAVAKANRAQERGLTWQVEEELPPEEEELPPEEETPPVETDQEETSDQNVTAEPGTPGEDGNAVVETTLTEIVNLPGVTAEYRGYQTQINYKSGDYFALNATEGNTCLVVNIGLSNSSEAPVEMNLFNRITQCSLLVNQAPMAGAMTTILPNDFMSFMGTLESAGTVETVLIFEIPIQAVEAIQTLALEFTIDGTTYRVALQ